MRLRPGGHTAFLSDFLGEGKPFWHAEFDGPAHTPVGEVLEHRNRKPGRRGLGQQRAPVLHGRRGELRSRRIGSPPDLRAARRRRIRTPCYTREFCTWTSARLTTEGKVALRHGRAEIRAKVPTGTGLLPAIWMLGDNGVEWPGQGRSTSARWSAASRGRCTAPPTDRPTSTRTGSAAPPSFRRTRRRRSTYAVDKQPHRVTWSVDGKPYATLTPAKLPAPGDWVFEQDMHLLLNVAVGGDWPGLPTPRRRRPRR
ncbi:glycoside hydrolase family 16 protein [Streptomyces sp. M19]